MTKDQCEMDGSEKKLPDGRCALCGHTRESAKREARKYERPRREKPFTVVGVCYCGCDDSFVEYVDAIDADEAAEIAMEERDRPGLVAGVFPGHVASQLSAPVLA